MGEYDLQPKRRKRFVATTDGDHDGPIFPNLVRHEDPRRPEPGLGGGHHLHRDRPRLRLYGRHPRCVVTPGGRICDQRSIDVRVAVAALKAAIRVRQPPKGCIHHSDRGSQYASKGLPRPAHQPRSRWVDGTAREPLRQCQGRELYKNTEGRGRLSDGLRNLRGWIDNLPRLIDEVFTTLADSIPRSAI